MADELSAGLSRLDPELASWVEQRWRSFQDATEPDQRSAIEACYPSLPLVWGASEFVTRACLADPALLGDLVASNDLFEPYRAGELAARVTALPDQDLGAALRRLRTRESVRIAWREIAGWAGPDELTTTMSDLADACIARALDNAYQDRCERSGVPRSQAGGEPVQMNVLGLGKLGGRELNFSSDIDLIFAYAHSGETGGPRTLSNHEFFLKLAKDLIQMLDRITEDGLVFRVDMRLRPNGQSGPLALSFDAMEHYYQAHGRDWERYALIKARNVAGDESTGHELLANLQPFVYRRYLDYGAFEAVRAMKEMINRELRRKGVQNNIKLGQGGIREVEFIAQSFQLIRGGRDPKLRTNRLAPALRQLGRSGVIPQDVCDELLEDYAYLRKVEHRLQMLRDQQTHRLPEADIDRKRLLVGCDAGSWEQLAARVARTCQRVHDHFDRIIIPGESGQPRRADEIEDLWLGLLDAAEAGRALSALGYRDPVAMIEDLHALRTGRVYHAHSKYGRERLDRLMPMCIREAARSADPDETLRRLIGFTEGVGRRSAYLVLLIENPLALSQLAKLIGASTWIYTWVRQHPLLLDELLDPITADAASAPAYIADELDQRLHEVPVDDLEQQMDILREVKHGQSLRVAAADVSGLIGWAEVGRRLSNIAEITLSRTVDLCAAGLGRTYGTPSVEPGAPPATLGVVAYGKLGSRELGYNSDLDIVFLHQGARPGGATENGGRSIGNEQYYTRLVQRIVHALTTRTGAGVLFEVDMRLRPSGRAGPVITSMDGYRSYQLTRAWTWEHQALVRARMIIGPSFLVSRFEEVRREVLCQPRDPAKLRQDISDMRTKMRAALDTSDRRRIDLKHGTGGIVDIEFMVQYHVLRWAHEHPDLVGPRNNVELIGDLGRAGIIDSGDAAALTDAYNCYLKCEHNAKLAERRAEVDVSELEHHRVRVEKLWRSLFD